MKILIATFEIINHIVWNGSHSLHQSSFNHEPWLGAFRLPLGADDCAFGLGFSLQLIILHLPQAKFLRASRRLHVLHSHMNSFLNNSVPDLFVDLDTDGALCDIPYLTCATMVKFMRHTLVDGAVHLDIHIITDFVRPQVGSQSNVTLLPERPGEEVSGT